MRTFLVAAICCLATASVAVADETSHRAAAKEILVVTNAKNLSAAMSDQVVKLVAEQLESTAASLPPGRAADFKKFQDDLARFIVEQLRFETMQDEFIDVYVKAFSEQDLRDMVAFYKTPLGQRLLEKMPAIMQESMQVGQRHAMAMGPQIQAKVETFMKAQKGKQTDKPKQGADKQGTDAAH